MKYGIEIANKIDVVYTNYCKSLCHDLNLNQTAFDILMFLANNPEYSSAKDIVNVRKIKANLVSINIDKLVKLGYLKRKHVSNDRRKVQLCLTDKANGIIESGRKVQDEFVKNLLEGIDEETISTVQKAFQKMEENMERMGKE